MENCVLLLGLLLIGGLAKGWARTTKDSFVGYVKKDEIIYTSISIPQYAQLLRMQFWSFGDSVSILLRYGGIPTVDEWDDMFDINAIPNALLLYDINPRHDVLYVGKML